jgi:hypothetical protein
LEYSLVKCYNSIMCACGILYFSIRNTNRYLLLIGACALLLYSKGPVVLRDHTNCIYGVATNVCRRKWGSWCFGRKLDSEDGRERSERPSRSPTCGMVKALWMTTGRIWIRESLGTQNWNPNWKPKPALNTLSGWKSIPETETRGSPKSNGLRGSVRFLTPPRASLWGDPWGLGESMIFFIPL